MSKLGLLCSEFSHIVLLFSMGEIKPLVDPCVQCDCAGSGSAHQYWKSNPVAQQAVEPQLVQLLGMIVLNPIKSL